MSETKFTKGEWNIKTTGHYYNGERQYKHEVLVDDSGVTCFEGSTANAHLMARAPNLYHALKRTNEELELLIDLYNKEVKDPAHFIDAETCYLNNIELAKARGEK